MEREGVEFNVLTVVTGYLARHIQSVFSALCSGGFRFQQYIPCLDPLEEARGGAGYSLSPEQYEDFLKTLFDLWYRELEQGRYWSVRYFDNLVWMLKGHAPEQCSMRGCCGLQYLVEADGSVYPCDFYGLDQYRLGNILQNSWEELDRVREETKFVEESRRVPEECGGCQWYPLCRNGCRRDRLETADGLGRNYYCRAYAGFFAYALPRLGRALAVQELEEYCLHNVLRILPGFCIAQSQPVHHVVVLVEQLHDLCHAGASFPAFLSAHR